MFSFSEHSKEHLATLHFDLQRVCEEAIKEIDFSILCGYRDQAAQDAAVASGKSKLHWPNSAHNSTPSNAMDLGTVPLDWNDKQAFVHLADVILATAAKLGIKLLWGGTFPHLGDLDHFELAK